MNHAKPTITTQRNRRHAPRPRLLVALTALVLAAFASGCPVNAIPNSTSPGSQSAIPAALQIAPTSALLNLSATQQFTASQGSAPYTYAVTSGGGTITANGLYTAPAVAGAATVLVTDSLGSTSEATVTIGSGPVISPTSRSVEISATYAFTATGGTAPLTWSVVSGGGSVSAVGLYTAPASPQSTVVRVTDALGFYSQAAVTVFRRNMVSMAGSTTALHNCVLVGADLSVKCFGSNRFGALGAFELGAGASAGTMGTNLIATKLGTGRTPAQIAIRNETGCAILDDGNLKCWGGALGVTGYESMASSTAHVHGSMGDYLQPVPLGAGRTAAQVAPGQGHICVVMDNGEVKCWGNGASGALGQDSTASYGHNTTTGSVYNMPAVTLGTTAIKVDGGSEFSCALLTGGTVKCWGDNSRGQLGKDHTDDLGDGVGVGDTMAALTAINLGNTATDIAVGMRFVCAILTGGSLKCWGQNSFGQLGIGSGANQGDDAGEMALLGTIDLGLGHTAEKVCTGLHHVCSILDDDTVKCWGYGLYGQLGTEGTANVGQAGGQMGGALDPIDLGTGRTATQIACGDYHSCALLDDGTVKCWGRNNMGQLGVGHLDDIGDGASEMGDDLEAADLGTGTVLELAAGGESTCVRIDEGGTVSMKCWGRNYSGESGAEKGNIGDHPGEMGSNLAAMNLGTGLTPAKVVTGVHRTCVIFNDGSAKCVGYNDGSAQMGTNFTTLYRFGSFLRDLGDNLAFMALGVGRTAKDLSFCKYGNYHSCVILDNDELKCWGPNASGQLGQDSVATLTDITAIPAVNVGAGRIATKVAATGDDFTCALLDNGDVKCWGRNNMGQLGQDHPDNLGDGVGVGDTMANLNAVNLGLPATDICTGSLHSCALLNNSTMKCWGYGANGALGRGNTDHIGDGAGEMAALTAIDLGTGRTVKKIACGSNHSCAILDNDRVKCWGHNANGALGIGNVLTKGDHAGEMGNNLPYVDLGTGRTALEIIAGGTQQTCVVLDNNDVKCWGYNTHGNLGQGHLQYIGDDPSEMGDNLPALDLD